MKRKGVLSSALIIIVFSLPLSSTVEAAAGDLDPTFGDNGVVDSNTADNTCACK
ncbi:MAG TPA: hypothetical protein VKA70_14265 [Blastocatellia bacterium]|nr:hypothetical protein [Blastocatellia bacterium]